MSGKKVLARRSLGLAMLAAAVLVACRTSPSGRTQGDVVLVVIDTLRADHLPMYGYERNTAPHLERFARDAVTYAHAITPGTWTVPAHGALFTGRWPSFHGAERVPGDHNLALALNDGQTTLAEIMQRRGFHTAAFVGNSTYVSGIFGFARGFAEYFDKDLYSPAKLREAVEAWLPTRREPLFLFINILDPHEPYEPPPPLDVMFPTKHAELGTMMTDLVYGGKALTPEMREHFVSQYDGEIVYADRELGAILARLEAAGRYDDALIVVTSDHGELLGEHGLAGHGVAPFEPETHVPLLVKYPGQRRGGERVERRVSTLGIFATLVQHVGAALPAGVDSRPLDAPHPVWVEDIASDGARVRVGYDGDQKLVVATPMQGAPWTALYDLAADPGEDAPIRDGSGAAALRRELDAFASAVRPVNTAVRPVIDPEREAKLKALGYLR
ncbi:MAG: hypothetical protein B6D46_03125 [Polyangiaceae bacterium UTPRO1]|jgi:arylsulfatase A-like enzyme|nr:sulfatase [Myxococcales bacterium]OQY68653.1 MAG: hypothetical protein B6D46_03125 [Polyangiaceae bacterium UTPRO1]